MTIGLWFTVASAIAAFFGFLTLAIKPTTQHALGAWLTTQRSPSWITDGAGIFASLFDLVFATKTLGRDLNRRIRLPSIIRSCIASLLFVSFATVVWLLLRPENMEFGVKFLEGDEYVLYATNGASFSQWSVLSLAGLTFIMNLLGDYISLIETRLLISLAKNSILRVSGVVVLDFLLTVAVFFFLYLVITPAFLTLQDATDYYRGVDARYPSVSLSQLFFDFQKSYLSFLYDIRPVLVGEANADQYLSLYVYCLMASTFVTSVWIWLHGSTVLILRAALAFSSVAKKTGAHTVIGSSPFLILGGIAVFIFSSSVLLVEVVK